MKKKTQKGHHTTGVNSELSEMAEEQKLQGDLEKYRKMALDLGAEEARIVPVSDIVQNIRSRMTCIFAHCPNLGSSWYCPPTWETPWEDAKAVIASYRYAILTRFPKPPEYFTGPASIAEGALLCRVNRMRRYISPEAYEYWRPIAEDLKKQPWILKGEEGHDRSREAASLIEAEARKDGHHFAFTGASSTCVDKPALCQKFGGTSCIMKTTGVCRFPGQSRPDGAGSMYIDFGRTWEKQGWKSWVAGWSIFPDDIQDEPYSPLRLRAGLIFIE